MTNGDAKIERVSLVEYNIMSCVCESMLQSGGRNWKMNILPYPVERRHNVSSCKSLSTTAPILCR